MDQIRSDIKFFPFAVNFAFYHNIKNKFEAKYEQKINFSKDEHISKLVWEIPLSPKLAQFYKRDSVFVTNLSNKEFNCRAACDINDEEVFNYIKEIVK